MNTRTVILPLINNSATSTVIGNLTSQQRLAYNQAVNILNREPNIPKRAHRGSTFGLNKRITTWRKENPDRAMAPYHIHQQGSEAAFAANKLIILHRLQRLDRIASAIEAGDQPHPGDTRPHRRTLQHRSRKHGSQTLSIRGPQFIKPKGPYTFTITGLDHVFRTRRALPSNILAIHFVEIPDRRRSANAPLNTHHYQLHLSISCDDPEPTDLTTASIDEYQGMDDGIKNHMAFSDGTRFSVKEKYPNRRPHLERQALQRKHKNSKGRRRSALQHLTRNRRRRADRLRQVNAAVIKQLERTRPAAIAVESKQVINLMRSASGPGRKAKAGLNRELANVALGQNQRILAAQAQKHGIHIIPVPAPGTSQTCPRCGHRHRKNRKSQASFQCRLCGWQGNADHSASMIIRNRGFVRTTERIHRYTPGSDIAPTGWQEQPSGSGQPALLPRAQSTHKPKRNATKPSRSPGGKRPGSRAPGRTTQVQGTRVPDPGPMQTPDGRGQALETRSAQGAQIRLL